jgi:hypothetical protein
LKKNANGQGLCTMTSPSTGPFCPFLSCNQYVQNESKAEIKTVRFDARFTPKSDMCSAIRNIRYWAITDQSAAQQYFSHLITSLTMGSVSG